MDENHTYLKERSCNDSLPYICITDDVKNASLNHLKTCLFRSRQTKTPNMTTQVISTRNEIHMSPFSYTEGGIHETTSMINDATSTSRRGENLTEQFSTRTDIHLSTVPYTEDDTQKATSNINDATTTPYLGENVTEQLSTRNDIHASTLPFSRGNIDKTTSEISDATTKSQIEKELTTQLISSNGTVASEISSKSISSESTHEKQTESKSTVTFSTFSDNLSTNHVYKTSSESHISSTSVNTEQEASTGVNVPNDGRTNNIQDKSETVTSSNVYKNDQHDKSQTAMIVGIACGGSVLVLTVIIILILRKRCIKKKKKLQKDLDAVHFQTVSDHEEDQDMDIEDMSPYSFAVSVGQNPVLYQGNNLYAVVNKTKQADDRNGESYPLASRASGTTVQNERKGGITNIYAVVNKNKKETSNGKEENYSGNDINIDGSQIFTGNDIKELMPRRYNDKKPKRQPGDDASYSLSTGTDYDHLNFRGSKNTSGLPNEADALYDHANCGLYDGVQHDVKQRGISDTYDHV